MPDPFDKLRDTAPFDPPSASEIRERAARIGARRRSVTAGLSGATALVVVVAALALAGPAELRDWLSFSSEKAEPTPVAPVVLETEPKPTPGRPEVVASPDAGVAAEIDSGKASAVDGPVAAREGASGGSAAYAARPVNPQLKPDVAFDVASDTVSPGEDVDLTINACNPHDHAIHVWFSDGQRYEFEAYEDGKLVWTWSAGRTFVQATGTESIAVGACRDWTAAWDGSGTGWSARPGSVVTIRGSLTTDPPIAAGQRDVCWAPCVRTS